MNLRIEISVSTQNSPPTRLSAMSNRSQDSDETDMIPQEISSKICIARQSHLTSSRFVQPKWSMAIVSLALLLINHLVFDNLRASTSTSQKLGSWILLASGHVVLAKDDRGQHLVLTGEDGSKGKGGGDQLVIAGSQMGGDGQDSNMVLQDAANREGDIVMSGKSWIIPGEDGHIVLADSRNQNQASQPQQPPINPLIFWSSFMNNRFYSRMMTSGFIPYLG